MLSDLEIARKARLEPIEAIGARYGIEADELSPYGRTKAKVLPSILDRIGDRPNGKYIVITAITPTPLGEGKTVNTIGSSLGLNRIGKKAICCIRQPSMGPVFGIKGGAAGGGNSQVVPMEDFNLHLTGDLHAVSAANNLLAAAIDTSILLKNPLRIKPSTISWRRVVDMNDRALRSMVIGLGGPSNGVPRETAFDITPASEVMAVLGLSEDIFDLRRRLGRIVIGSDEDGEPVTADQLQAAGAMTVILREAIAPTLMQTLEGTAAFVHTGPFANIAHGNSSIIADRIALKLADYVVTESGFGADMGCEKFFNIKCRISGLKPDAVGLVATVRALKAHGDDTLRIVPGKPLDERITSEDLDLLGKGCANLEKQIANVKLHGVPVVVAVNRFPTDTEKEIELIRERALAAGASAAIISEVHAKGGEGGEDFGQALVEAAESPSEFKHLYPLDISIREKLETLATRLYGAGSVSFSPLALRKMKRFEERGWGQLPVCVAKTALSLSHDPALRGAPKGYEFPITDIRASVGAGFLYALAGDIMTMPGLGSSPAYQQIDIDEHGQPMGLF
ncbi:MAG: formate--tetrahydrofolate ligase [Planctomycetota bacterium]